MALSKKQLQELNTILSDLEKVNRFLMQDKTVIALHTNLTHAKKDLFINQESGEQFYQFNKHAGSDLCYLGNAKRALDSFIDRNIKKS